VEQLAIADEDREFLVEAGLPNSAAPFLSFDAPKSGELRTVADTYGRPDKFRRYRIIGSDGSGNPIVIDEEKKGEVVCLDHEEKFERTLINKSIRQLAESLLVYRSMVQGLTAAGGKDALSRGIPVKVRQQLHRDLKKIDPAAMKTGGFWPEETLTADASTDYPATVFQDLISPDASIRLKASNQLQSELRKGATKQRKEQFGNTAATSALMAALDDPDPQVVHNVVVALGAIAGGYFKDDRVYDRLLPLVKSQHPLTSRWAIIGLIDLRAEASLDDVLPLCREGSNDARAAVFSHIGRWLIVRKASKAEPIREKNLQRLRQEAVRALSDAETSVRQAAASLLGEIGDQTSLPALREWLKRDSYWLTQQVIEKAIAAIEKRS
jgi:HEAT repeat protein